MSDRPADELPLLEPSLFQRAKGALSVNDRGVYTMPGPHLYPHQWLWDSCFVAIGLRHLDVPRAQKELISLLRGQWHNGMLPNIIFRTDAKYSADRNVWRSWVNPNAPDDVATSGITQPPMLAEAIVRVGEKLEWPERRRWYSLMYPALLHYHQWLYSERDPHGEGLVLMVHPWEVGLDNTPPWTAELQQHQLPGWIRLLRDAHLLGVVDLFRRDGHTVPIDERFSTLEVLAMFDIQRRLRRKAYDTSKILDHSLFTIEDLGYNCMLIRANEHLRHIAASLRETLPADLMASMQKTAQTLENLWDAYDNQYYSRDFITHKLLRQPSVATLLPLYAGCINKERAAALVRLLEDEKSFGLAYPVPSVPANSPYFKPKRYWQGPSWVNINWLIIDGLKRYGYHDHAAALTETTLEMVDRSGFAEYFDPLTGEAAGADNFSWTAALTIDLLADTSIR